MLDKQDIKQIGDILEEKLGVAIEEKVRPIVKSEVSAIVKTEVSSIVKADIVPMVKAEIKASEDRIIVAVGEMLEQNVLPTIDTLGVRLDDMQKTIANLPDKAYIDEKFASFSGEVVVREKKQVFSAQDLQQLNAIHVFPSPPAVA
ncbi:MAG: hypothetical protein Q7S48_00200 [bacterium]|nr:hypothetical protein [bacterium]